jgi:hypothetical protein
LWGNRKCLPTQCSRATETQKDRLPALHTDIAGLVSLEFSSYMACGAAPYLKRLVAGFPPWRSGFHPGSGQVGFMVDKVALGQVFSEYFNFPCQSSFHHLLHNHPHLSSGAGTIGQKWPQYKGLSPTPLAMKKNKNTWLLISIHIATLINLSLQRR